MLRASAACEAAGVPTSSLVAEGFIGQAKATSIGLGLPNIPIAMIPGHPSVQSEAELRRNLLEVTVAQVIGNLTRSAESSGMSREPGARDIVCTGGFEEINAYFLEKEWSDGLPIVPPTLEHVERFLACTDRNPEEVLGVMLPDNRAATVWSVAVNGVMAGCRPEYMPLLITLVEAMTDPEYGVEHSGNTPGGETLIVLNGPIVKQLGFNCTQGVMRDGFQANTSVGRFWRLYLRNVAGFLPHKTDKATFGNTWRVVIAENEETVARIGWQPLSVDMGFSAGDNTVTIARYTGGDTISSMAGSTPEEMLPYLAEGIVRQTFWQVCFSIGQAYNRLRPLVLMSPIIAETIARAGWSKQDVQRYFFQHARIPAWQFERLQRDWRQRPIWNLADEAAKGRIPRELFAASDDPNRMIPLVWSPEHFMIVVTGDPLRTSCYVFGHNGRLGFPVTKKVRPPAR